MAWCNSHPTRPTLPSVAAAAAAVAPGARRARQGQPGWLGGGETCRKPALLLLCTREDSALSRCLTWLGSGTCCVYGRRACRPSPSPVSKPYPTPAASTAGRASRSAAAVFQPPPPPPVLSQATMCVPCWWCIHSPLHSRCSPFLLPPPPPKATTCVRCWWKEERQPRR